MTFGGLILNYCRLNPLDTEDFVCALCEVAVAALQSREMVDTL